MLMRDLVAGGAFVMLVCGLARSASPETVGAYQFQIDPAGSGLNATLDTSVNTAGTLVGDYTDANPGGTRTKPGIFGPFGSTENVPVDVQFVGRVSGPLNTDTRGGFTFDVDSPSGSLVVRNYAADFLSAGPVNVPITLTLNTESFRTRSPSSTYLGGIPITLPIGQASLSALSVRQVGAGLGTISKTGPNTYDFTVIPIVQVTLTVNILGTEFSIPQAPAPLPFTGSVSFTGMQAVLNSMRPIDFSQSAAPGQTLPQFALALPTILPPGDTANVLLDLTLSDITASLAGTITTHADGMLVPSPAAAAVLLGLLAFRRRR